MIEVDGALFHQKPSKDDREAKIQLSLGVQWRILHIPAELIAKDIKKLKACIDAIN